MATAFPARTIAALTLLAAASMAHHPAQGAAPPGPPPMAATNALPDNVGTGRFPAMKEEVASLPDHVVYRPHNLDALGGTRLGVVAWGNGGCSDDGASTRFHLLELASHGYLVIANGRIWSGPGAPQRPAGDEPAPRVPGALPPPRTKAEDLITAIDWALAESKRPGSPYFGKVDPRMVAVSGFSCGGLQALVAAADPRVTAAVLHNTGVLNDGPGGIPGMDVAKDALAKLHTPVLYVLGGPSDIAYPNGMDDFRRIGHVPAAVANIDVGHGGTYFEPDGGAAAQVAVSWLEWQLRGDERAGALFTGKDCGLCKDARWTFEKKGLP